MVRYLVILAVCFSCLVVLELLLYLRRWYRNRRTIYLWAGRNGYAVHNVTIEGQIFWIILWLLGLLMLAYVAGTLAFSRLMESWNVKVMDDEEGPSSWAIIGLLGLFVVIYYVVSKMARSWLRQSWHITVMDDEGGIRTGRVFFGRSEHLGDDADKDMEVRWL